MTSSPSTKLFDCHAHVYEQVYAAVAQPRYLPAHAAPRAVWVKHQEESGVAGGVIVQISFLGTDNSEMLKALRALGTARFRGVAVVALDAGAEELQALKAEGVCGVRWNLVKGAALPELAEAGVRSFLKRLNQAGLHLQIQLEGDRLGPYLRVLVSLADRIVIDHFGIPTTPSPGEEPWIAALKDVAASSDLFVKFSAPYRSPVDVAPHADVILEELGPGRVVWGSDWPWTNYEGRHNYAETVAWLDLWLGETYWGNVERASRQLYGFTTE
jgi:predicted TIM-barrel fold metal-dependent hydrolase